MMALDLSLEECRGHLRRVAKFYQMILLIPLGLFMGYFCASVFLNIFQHYFESCNPQTNDDDEPQICQTFKIYLTRLDGNIRTGGVDIGIWLVIQSIFTIQLLKETRFRGTRARDVASTTATWMFIQLLYFSGEVWVVYYNFWYNYDRECTDLVFGFVDCHQKVMRNLCVGFLGPRVANICVGGRFYYELSKHFNDGRCVRRHVTYQRYV